MSKTKLIASVLLVIITIISAAQPAEAQRRRHRARVVRAHRVTVVKIHPRVNRRAHIRYAALPRWGAVVAVAPGGAAILRPGPDPYYFHNGIYYSHRPAGYVVVRPVRGIRIRVLPVGYRRVIIGPRPYFYYYGTFYSKVDNADEYEVIDAPEGAIVDALPDGYEVKTINDTEYYELDGVYYAEVETDLVEDGTGYKVVKI